ncbi:MAG TPA: ABC transporter permease [Vicinamibacterales bacterium]
MAFGFGRLVSHRFIALVRKELNQIKRDKRIMLSLVLPPLLQLMLFGSVMNPEVTNLPLGVVDDSRSPASRDLIAALGESGSFRLHMLYGSIDTMGDDISKGTIDAGVVIPYDFARDLERGRPVTVQVLLNAMNANTAAISQGYIQGVVQSFNTTLRQPSVQINVQPVPTSGTMRGVAQLRPTLLYNPGGVTTWFIVTGLLGVLLLMNGTITASTTMVKEREAGTLEQLLMTPASISEIIIAKIAPPFFLLGITGLVAMAVLELYFHVPFRGSVTLLVVTSALCLLCGIGIGTAVATVTKSAQQAQLAIFFLNPPLISLSGALMPAEAMPSWMRPFTAINPVYHYGVIARATLIKGSGLIDLWPNVLALLIFAVGLVSVSVWRFRRQLG